MNLRSVYQLNEALSKDLSWRKRELIAIKSSYDGSSGLIKNTFGKMLHVSIYSHWEGFIKISASAYIFYLNKQGLKLNLLHPHFQILQIFERFKLNRGEAFEQFLNYANQVLEGTSVENFKISNVDKHIHTESNLNYKVFLKLIRGIGINDSFYAPKQQLIDNQIVEPRHRIAHGENYFLDHELLIQAYEAVFELLDNFKTDIENAVSEKKYLKLNTHKKL